MDRSVRQSVDPVRRGSTDRGSVSSGHEMIKFEVGHVFTTAFISLDIPENGLFADFVKRLKNDTCFHGYD